MIKGAYIHIPFCDHICYYCDFNKYFLKYQPVDEYLAALEQEIATVTGAVGDVRPETIYIGGGTPTALNPEQMGTLLDFVRRSLNPDGRVKEWTVEANPENLDGEKLRLMKAAGVNRLSIGVQTFNDRLLQAIGRAHDREAVFRGVEAARRVGFDNLSIDLMFGLPGQTMEDLKASLRDALSLAPEHVSVYSLQIEPRTIFYNRLRQGRLRRVDEDVEADMYAFLIDFLEQRGYTHYEISNFALPGKESRHNLIYWDNEEYFGFGAGAHGYVHGERYINASSVKGYIRRVREDGDARIESRRLTRTEKIEEEMFLGLRKRSGVNKDAFYEKFGADVHAVYSEAIARLKEQGLLYEDEQRLALTKKGVFLGNEVFQAFLMD